VVLLCKVVDAIRAPMPNLEAKAVNYSTLRKACLDAVRQWPGCETITGIQLIRTDAGRFTVRVTLYGLAYKKVADRAIACVQRELQRQFRLME
jgi:hypothetical protein